MRWVVWYLLCVVPDYARYHDPLTSHILVPQAVFAQQIGQVS